MKRPLNEIARATGARLIGDGHVEVGGVASIESATVADLVFVDDVEANVAAARALGWRAVWFRSTEQTIAEIEAAFSAA